MLTRNTLAARCISISIAATLTAAAAWPQSVPDSGQQAAVADLSQAQVSPPGLGLSRWINPATAPFIPVPVIGVDPNSGTTLGILPTWVHTNEKQEISRIIAPDLVHNPNFGYGVHGRIFDYPSDNEQWSVVAGIQQRVQRLVDVEFQNELSRKQRWSLNYSLIYNRDGTPRFFGFGNGAVKSAQTNYTKSQQLAQLQIGLNLSHIWQILYTLRLEKLNVEPGTLAGIPTIDSRFPNLLGSDSNHLLLNRLSVIYDTRDNLVVPREGMQWVVYGGLASRSGAFNDSLYSEAGIDGRSFWVAGSKMIVAAHLALHYLVSANQVPFWALSNLGGDRDEIGGQQELRGYGAGRFYDRDSFATTVELRRTVWSFDAASSHIDLEVTPFLDVARVFAKASTDPLAHLHKVVGIGFRGVARPFVVGYVDLGYGSEGIAAFTGINYPF